ncbi:hypothetical protein [Ahrensia marina]|uniref:Uncharacterized protein n=1 Tax=Ahrensia marina TaxID=1514904 RepID=A0A0M9GM10_9HYPH|nr:hypothetical protein [Ahrensia marina]KPB00997.1 hypothetical protein SU32_10115 [Ahrensia marina]
MTSFPKLRAYIDQLTNSDHVDQIIIDQYMRAEAPEGAAGAAFKAAMQEVEAWIFPLRISAEFGDQFALDRAKLTINSAIDELQMVCAVTPDAGLQ